MFFKKIIFSLFLFVSQFFLAQIPGTIYQPVISSLGKQILDPNQDGFTSLTSAGFQSGGVDYGANSELKMIGLPSLIDEPNSDLNNGSAGGLTDLVSSTVSNTSVFLLVKNVDGVNYLVLRFRAGSAGTAGKAYAVIFDTNGSLSGPNQGFELEVSLQTGSQSGGVYVRDYRIAGGLPIRFPISEYSQRSIAATSVNGNLDYFLDFFVPFSALGDVSQARIVAATGNNSSSILSSGGISDIQGVNDANYNYNVAVIFNDLISSFPTINLADLTSDFNGSNWLMQASVPTVNDGITLTSTSISGTSKEANGTIIKVYKNGLLLATTTVTNNVWTLTGVTGLVAGNLITATANASGKTVSGVSNSMIVSGAQDCFAQIPAGLVRGNQQTITGTWSQQGISPNGSNVRIDLYEQNSTNQEIISRNISTYVQSNGSWSLQITPEGQADFNNKSYLFKAIIVASGCASGYSSVSAKTSGAGTITISPTINTTPIYQSVSSQNIVVRNNETANSAVLILYLNGVQILSSPTAIPANGTYTFSVAGLQENDVVSARAQVQLQNYWLSNVSTSVIVQLQTTTQSSTPVITGPLSSGANKTISGFCSEAPGTVISVYKGTTLFGTTTVSAFGTWSLSGVTLAQGDIIKATAKAVGKTLSLDSATLTVNGTPPSAPTISNEYIAGQTQISGTGGSGTVRVYVDGVEVASLSSSGSWNVTVPSDALYKGAVITAKNQVGELLSVAAASKTVTGIGGFCIVQVDGSPLTTTINSGESLPVKIIAIQGTTCPGTIFTNFSGTVSIASNGVVFPSGVTSNFSNGELTTTLTFGGLGNTNITILNTDDPTTTAQASINVQNPALWVGGTSNAFEIPANWLNNYVPGYGAAITFDATVQRDLHLNGDRVIGNLDFNSNAHSYKLVLGATDVLTVQGSLSNTSAYKSIKTVSGAKVNLLGYGAAGDIYFDNNSVLEELTMNRSNSGTLVVKNPIRIEGKLNLTQGTITVDAIGLITLASSATKTAIVPYVSGSVVGNVCVERFIPAKRAFRFLSPTVTTTSSIYANWQENGNNAPGYGTHITGIGGVSNGFDGTNTNNYSMFFFDVTSNNWLPVTQTNNVPLTAGTSYRLMVRGDRTISMVTNNPAPTNTVLRATGTLFTGNYNPTLNSTADGYTLVGNPYQSPIDIKEALTLASANVTDQITYWDPTLNVRGGFVTRVVSIEQNSTSSSFTEVLQPGQSIFVKNTNSQGTRSLSVRETHKRNNGHVNLFRNSVNTTSTHSLLRIKLKAEVESVWKEIDGAITIFNTNYNPSIDSQDAQKIANLDEEVGFKVNGTSLAFNLQPNPEANQELPIALSKCRFSNYKWTFDLQNYEGPTPYLLDVLNGTYTKITPATEISFSVDIQNTSLYNNRFKVVFSNQTLGSDDFGLDHIALYPNPGTTSSAFQLFGFQGDVKVNVFSALGQEIAVAANKDAFGINVKPKQNLSSGIYFVVVEQEGKVKRMKWIIE